MEGGDDKDKESDDDEANDITRKKININDELHHFKEIEDNKTLDHMAEKAKYQFLEMFNNKDIEGETKEVITLKTHTKHDTIDFDVAVAGDRELLIVKFVPESNSESLNLHIYDLNQSKFIIRNENITDVYGYLY